jgi:uncharacterized phiE125 gp8 family phage protein
MTNLTVISPPGAEPVSLASAKAFLRIGHGGEDGLVSDLIASARARVEQAGGLALVSRAVQATWLRWPAGIEGRGVSVPIGPVTELSSVQVIDAEGVAVDHTGRFRLDCGRVCLRPWSMVPAVPEGGRVEVVFEAGFGDAADVPADLIEAVMLTLRETYEARDLSARRGRDEGPLPERAEAILQARRGVRL